MADNERVYNAQQVMISSLRDFRNVPCESTLTLLLMRVHDCSIEIYAQVYEGAALYWDVVRDHLSNEENANVYHSLYRDLICGFKYHDTLIEHIKEDIELFGKSNFNDLTYRCTGKTYDLYSEVIGYCNKVLEED